MNLQTTHNHDARLEMANVLAARVCRLLERVVELAPDAMAFYAIPLDDRLVLRFMPGAIGDLQVPRRLVEKLSTEALQGRRVVLTKGLYLQISYYPDRGELKSQSLDLSQQPGGVYVPIGLDRRGNAIWKSIIEMDSALIGGARRMGKTSVLHGWIQALIHGDAVDLVLYDGKGGVEFGRYAGTHIRVIADDVDLPAGLAQVQQEADRRRQLYVGQGVVNLAAYNALPGVEKLRPIVMILDELADLPGEAEDILAFLARKCGAYGVHPVVGIQRPDAKVMQGQLRSNLTTRIALPVASVEDSRIILQRSGAEKLPKVRGRMLFVWDARLVEAQAFQINLPGQGRPAPAGTAMLHDWERRLVEEAQRRGGWFRVRELANATGESRDRVNRLARAWELRGWLTPVQFDAQGRRLGRKVTPSLLLSAGFGGQADLADLADFPAESETVDHNR